MKAQAKPARLSSSERINYSLRPNKHIERNIVFRALQRLEHELHVADYRYVGMGSLWFVDFLMAHRLLGITDMVSVESHLYSRANANRPLNCIRVAEGFTKTVLRKESLEKKRAVLWLDYDGPTTADVLEDLTYVIGKVPTGSVILATVNANPLRDKAKIDALEEALGDLLTDSLTPEQMREGPDGFAGVIATALTGHLQEAGQLRSSGRYSPLFNFYYADGASMVTIGGIIADDATKDVIARSGVENAFGVTRTSSFTIDVPLLTIREKLVLDRFLPVTDIKVAAAKEAGVFLSADQLEAYRSLYPYYPMFAEILP
jgi:hypothetical protein